MSEELSPNPLEEAITRVAEEREDIEEDAAVAARSDVLKAFAAARVTVLAEEPVAAGAPPEADKPLLFVTDGDDHTQAMLAVFTRPGWAREYHESQGGSFAYPAEVPAPWAVLQLPDAAGVMINPNRTPCFRIGSDVAGQMRDGVARAIEAAQPSATPGVT